MLSKKDNKILEEAEKAFKVFSLQLRKIEAERDEKLIAIIKKMENKQLEEIRNKINK